MSEDRSFCVIPDVGGRQNIKSEYHVYRTGGLVNEVETF